MHVYVCELDSLRYNPGERGDALRESALLTDAGFVVPDQPAREPYELLDHLPRPQQQSSVISLSMGWRGE